MSKKTALLLGLIAFSLILPPRTVFGQSLGFDATSLGSMDVKSLNDKQIQSLLQQASAQGLSVDQAIQIAKSRGASQSQIDEFMKRVNNSKKKTPSGTTSSKEYPEALLDYAEQYTQKEDFVLSEKLKRIFGHQLFNSKNLSFEPSVNLPLPKDYVLGVNDELTINVSGASQQTYQLTIDRNGMIFIPNIGPVSLMGVEFDEARRIIKRRLTSVFHGMSGANPNTWADVSVSALRSIKVNVIGEAMTPGTYTLPATATAFNALYLSGGPNENGSFRNIRVMRDNKLLKTIDIYEYLLNSDASNNVALRDQDVLYIPTYENRVVVDGAFKRPGFYELKTGETMANLMTFTGGFSTEAFKGSVSVTRMNGAQKRMADVKAEDFTKFQPEAGDSVFAGSVLDRYENRVSITGAVFRPGTYALSEGMTLSKLFEAAQGLREDVFSNRGIIFRIDKDLTPTSLAFSVRDIKEGISDIELQREDSVVVQDIFSMRQKQNVRIYGEVQKPGEFEYHKGMTIYDLIFQAGGLKEAASESFIEISRRHDYEAAAQKSDDLVNLFQMKVSRNLNLSEVDKRFYLEPFDYIYVRKAPSYFEQKTVSIEGEVLYPGPYSIQSKNERISDLLERCGGLTKHAYVDGATLYRSVKQDEQKEEEKEKEKEKDSRKLEDEQETVYSMGVDTLMTKATKNLTHWRVELQLSKVLKNPNSVYNYHLKQGDSIVIPEVSEEVHVAGAILNPVGLAYEPRHNAHYYIERSGGFSDNANTRRVYVLYSDGTTRVTKNMLFFKTYPRVLPGSKIIVPEKEERQKTDIARWLAIASTFSSLAVAIAAILR